MTLFDLPADAEKTLTQHPELTVIRQADYRSEMGPTIDAILGWDDRAAAILAAPNHVRFIQAVSAGVDYLPLATLAQQGIILANTSGIHAAPIAASVLGATLAFARGLFPIATSWDGQARRAAMFELTGERAAVFGTGHIGQAIARQLGQQGMTVIGVNRRGRETPGFAEVTTAADLTPIHNARVIVNVMPLTPATQHFFDAAFWADLTAAPVFINVGRGPSVDTDALLAALRTGQLTGAALDVFEQEPLPAGSPLWHTPNLLLTPHVSGTVTHLRQAVAEIFLPNVLSLDATGAIVKNQVDLATGY
nr:NAD(P)-dependent oxidoreductase [Lacticaseibacillus absianus]